MDKNFPVGLKVLVVDDDTFYLNSIESQLKSCQYHVTTTNKVRKALRMLEENKNNFQLMIINAEMVDLDVIKLLQFLNLEVNLPIVLLSTSNDTKQVMEWMQTGASDCLVKPVEINELRQLWKHVFRWNNCIHHRSGDRLAGGNKGKEIIKCSGEDNNNVDELEDNDELAIDMPIQKNPRFAWSIELHQKFVDVVNQLGLNKAFPKKIVELMNVEGLTREKVASHLQKYKLYLKKLNSGLIHQGFRFDAFGPDGVHINSLGGGHRVYRSLPGTGMVGHMSTNADLSRPRHLSSFPILQTPQPPNPFNNSSRFISPNLLENKTNNLFPNVPNPSLFSPLPTSLVPYENPPLLSLREYQNQSSSPIFSPSSTLGTSGLRGSSIFPNFGPSQPQSCLHNNLLSPNDAHNPLDSFCGISSLSGSALNSDGLSGLKENFNSIGQQHIWPNQSQDYVLDPYNISSTINSNTTPTISPTVVGTSPFAYFDGTSSNTGGQNPNNEIDHNIDEYVGSSENLEELIGRILK